MDVVRSFERIRVPNNTVCTIFSRRLKMESLSFSGTLVKISQTAQSLLDFLSALSIAGVRCRYGEEAGGRLEPASSVFILSLPRVYFCCCFTLHIVQCTNVY